VSILGVNGAGQEAGNGDLGADHHLPWLQDRLSVDAWGLWHVTYRDLVILDPQNRPVAVYNLTEHNLARGSAYDSLKTILLDLAGRPVQGLSSRVE
jgi:hypothetical protein